MVRLARAPLPSPRAGPSSCRRTTMLSIIAPVYGALSYACFFVSFLYAVGFIHNIVVPRSVDVGPAAPTGGALAIALAPLTLVAVQHSVRARPGFKRWWTRLVPKPLERSTYVLF